MFIYKMHRPSLPACNAWESGRGQGLIHQRPQEHRWGGAWERLEGHTSPAPTNPAVGRGWTVLPLQGHDRVSSRFMYSCKAFKRASISAMSAAWWSELYSVRVGMSVGGYEGPEATGSSRAQCAALSTIPVGSGAGEGAMGSPRLTFDGDPAPRISQVSLMSAAFNRSELL